MKKKWMFTDYGVNFIDYVASVLEDDKFLNSKSDESNEGHPIYRKSF